MTETLILFALDGFHFALDATKVERVTQATAITPLPDLPTGVSGIVGVGSAVVPVFDLRARLGLPVREVRSGDHFIIAHCGERMAALIVDDVTDVTPAASAAVIPAAAALPGLESVGGWGKINGELIMIHDLWKFLSMDTLLALENAVEA